MTIDDKIRDEKLQYHFNREAVKISSLSSGKTDKYEYLTCKDNLKTSENLLNNQTNHILSSKRNY